MLGQGEKPPFSLATSHPVHAISLSEKIAVEYNNSLILVISSDHDIEDFLKLVSDSEVSKQVTRTFK